MKFLSKKCLLTVFLGLLINVSSFIQAMEMESDTITLVSSDGKEIKINQDIAKLSGTLKTLLEISPKQEYRIKIIEFKTLEVIVSILEKIYKELIPRPDNGYITAQIEDIIDEKFVIFGKKPEEVIVSADITELINLLKAAEFLDIKFLINQVARLLVIKDKSEMQRIVEKNDVKNINESLHIYLKKHLILRDLGIKELSIMDLIAKHYDTPKLFSKFIKDILITGSSPLDPGQPDEMIYLQLKGKGITSLYGIKFLSKILLQFPINVIEISENFILDNMHDPDFPHKPFEFFKSPEVIVLHRNPSLKILPYSFFQGENISQSLKMINISETGLSILPETIFESVRNVEFIDLAKNKLTVLPVRIFRGMTKLKTIYLDNNSQLTLPKGIFSGLNNLTYINLKGVFLPDVKIDEIKEFFKDRDVEIIFYYD